MAALLRRRRSADFHTRRLAAHMAGAMPGEHWPRRNRQPAAALAKLGHLLAGVILGATLAAIVLAWASAGFPS